MKVLMINGSPRVNGNTSIALQEMETIKTYKKGIANHAVPLLLHSNSY